MSTRRQKLALESCRASAKVSETESRTEAARAATTNIYSKKYLTKAPTSSRRHHQESSDAVGSARKAVRAEPVVEVKAEPTD